MTELQRKASVFTQIDTELKLHGLEIDRQDHDRPWGGFFVIKEEQAEKFMKTYFSDAAFDQMVGNRKVSPKILIVAPGKRLSWQYHHRRSEVWRVIGGKVGVVKSDYDEENEMAILTVGDQVVLACGERHRLIGLDDYGLVAEIWQHTDPENPSDEEDIVRLQDDFGRGDSYSND